MPFFPPTISMITNVILIVYNSSINRKLILRDLHLDAIFPVFAPFRQKKIFQTQPQHCFTSLSNMTPFRSWMNQPFKWFGSVAVTLNFTFKLSFHKKKSQISVFNILCLQYNNYIWLCNCRLNTFMSCIKQCVNAFKCYFRKSKFKVGVGDMAKIVYHDMTNLISRYSDFFFFKGFLLY